LRENERTEYPVGFGDIVWSERAKENRKQREGEMGKKKRRKKI